MVYAFKQNIDPYPSNCLFDLKLIVLNVLASVKKIFSDTTLLSGFIDYVNKDLNRLRNRVEFIKSIIPQIQKEELANDYITIEKAIKKFNKIYASFEKSNFFDNEENKKLSQGILEDLYSVENHLRHILFNENPIPASDKELHRIASIISFKSLSKHSKPYAI
ncbi:hypothetical protein [Limnovirga soli]|uniref:Uncharacterized protein n=1 Tax=Limnovirga soli TaxID=2656915 RepID=A0A8J8FJB3_9BACT|nr:hypothetical protein [Limnovirga soli]NNV57374.1 hypothetical protein [Limnovirga soli]